MTDSGEFVVVDNGEVRLTFWPGCGGRLIGAAVGGRELLWRSPEYLDSSGRLIRPREEWAPLDGTMGSWANVGGSKTWPAPQGWGGEGEWAGPPDGVLDSGRWSIETRQLGRTGTRVVMASPEDPRSGLQVTRRFDIPASGTGFVQRNTFRNIGTGPVRWSIWEVCQVNTEAPESSWEVAASVSDSTEPTVMLAVVGDPPVGEMTDGATRVIPVTDVVGKLGLGNATGQLGLRHPDGRCVQWEFETLAGAVYPDGGQQVELWLQYPVPAPLEDLGGLHPRARLIELEVLGPLVTLAPGETTSLDISWRLTG